MLPGSAAVVGAGLGGLTAALALQRAGWRVRVYEQADRLGEVGAGISVSPGAGRSLESLGLGPTLLAASDPVPDVAFADHATGTLLAGTLQKALPVDRGFEEARHIHRADLHALLLKAVTSGDPDAVVTGRKLVAVEDDGSSVAARFADGSTAAADLLVGADGSRSAVRAHLFGPGAPVFAGQVAYRCLIPREIAEPYLSAGSAVVSVGPSRIFHRYLIRHGALVNVIGIARIDAWTGEGWNTPATTQEFLELYADFNADVRGLIGCAAVRVADQVGALRSAAPRNLRRGRVTLLGDAAHPILPFLGLGAALAIEDGVVLAQALEDARDIERALVSFQALRQDRVETVRTQTIRQGEIIQGEAPDAKTIAASPSQDQRLFQFDPTG